MKETDLVREVISVLRLHGIHAWRCNTGMSIGVYKGKRRAIRFGVPGMSDVLGIVPPSGRLLAVECKVGRNQVAGEQHEFIRAIRAAGGIALVVRDSSDRMMDRINLLKASTILKEPWPPIEMERP